MKKDLLVKKVESASKEELFMMLLDGARTFATQALARMKENDYFASNQLFIKTQRIILELVKSLDRRLIEERLYQNIIGLYMFCYRRFVQGNVKKDENLINEGLQILTDIRNMWKEAIDKNLSENLNPKNNPEDFEPGSLDFSS